MADFTYVCAAAFAPAAESDFDLEGIHRDKLQLSFLLVLHKPLALKKRLTIPAAAAVAAAAATTTKAATAGAEVQPVLQLLQVKINNNCSSNRNLNHNH